MNNIKNWRNKSNRNFTHIKGIRVLKEWIQVRCLDCKRFLSKHHNKNNRCKKCSIKHNKQYERDYNKKYYQEHKDYFREWNRTHGKEILKKNRDKYNKNRREKYWKKKLIY